MKIKEFTEEELSQLRQSEYILDVTPQFVYYSAEFKKRFYREYQEGKKPRDVHIGKGFTEITSESCTKQVGRSLTPEAKIRRLEHELAYTHQELEFVKKIIAAGREERK